VLHDEARVAFRAGPRPGPAHDFAMRVARSTGARVTLIALDGRVIG
jgi:hypothetical protein